MKINYCDALIIGGGLAGLRAAVAAQKQEGPVFPRISRPVRITIPYRVSIN